MRATPIAALAGPHNYNRVAYSAVHVVADRVDLPQPNGPTRTRKPIDISLEKGRTKNV